LGREQVYEIVCTKERRAQVVSVQKQVLLLAGFCGTARKLARVPAPQCWSAALEVLNRSLMSLGSAPAGEGSKIAALASLRIFLARIQAIFSILHFSDQ